MSTILVVWELGGGLGHLVRARPVGGDAGHGTVATMLLAGRPILVIPFSLEQVRTAQRLERLGVGLAAPPERPDMICSRLIERLNNPQYATAAGDLAARYAEFSLAAALDRVVDLMQSIIDS